MKKLFRILIASVVASLCVVSCNKFGDINKDPNNPTTAYTNYLFTYATNYIPWFVLGDADNGYDPWQQEWNGYLSESKNNQYGQLGTTSQYTRVGSIYLYGLKNLKLIIDMNEDEAQKNQPNVLAFGSNANQIAVAKTLSAFYYMSLTDMIGPIVMSEAFQGKDQDNWKPKYDKQEDVYKQLDNLLKEAYTQFDESGSLNATADVIYGGDIAKWKKLNASIRMLLAIKLCDVAPEVGKTRFAAAYADGGMEAAEDGFNFTYDDLHWNMLYYWCSNDYAGAGKNAVPNMIIVEAMKELKDNRMFQYFEVEGYKGKRKESIFPRDQYTSFYGAPFGLSTNTDVTNFGDCVSSVNSKMLAMTATIPVIPTARVLLTEAEAAYRGWISADAKTLYEDGIKASFEWWGADGADAYVSSPAVSYDAAKGLEQIATQRWIASYLSDGVEAWSDWRRLDIPKMPVGPAAIDKGIDQYPYRLGFYADTDVAYNEENYKEAMKDITGEDQVTGRVWWDVAENTKVALTAEQQVPSVVIPAEWEVVCTGVYSYVALSTVVDGLTTINTTLYEDKNHPGEYMLKPWGNLPDGSLLFSAGKTEAGAEKLVVLSQNTGFETDAHEPILVAEFDVDQGKDNGYSGWDEDDQCYYFYMIYRKNAPRGVEGTGILAYDYETFTPDGN